MSLNGADFFRGGILMSERKKDFDANAFDYGKAEEALAKAGCPFPEHIWEQDSRKGIEDYMRTYGLEADAFFIRGRR